MHVYISVSVLVATVFHHFSSIPPPLPFVFFCFQCPTYNHFDIFSRV